MKSKDAEGRRRWALASAELVAAVNRDDSVEDVIASIAGHALGLLELDMCAVMLPNETQDRLLVVGSAGLSDAYIRRLHAEHPLRVDRTGASLPSPSVEAFVTGQTVLVPDIGLSPGMTEWRELALAEGYAALVAAPLVEGDRAVGVLVGYSRDRRTYPASLIELLDMFAVHAGATIQSARRRDELQDAVASLNAANSVLRRQSHSLEILDRQHRRLMQVMANDVGVSGVVTMLAELLHCSVTVEDPDGRVIASASEGTYVAPPRLAERRSERIKAALGRGKQSRAGSTPVTSKGGDGIPFWLAPVTLHNEVVAIMWVGRAGLDLDEPGRLGVERFALAVALEISKQRSADQVRVGLSRDLVADLLSEFATVERSALLERAAAMGHDLTQAHVLLAARGDEDDDGRAQRALYDVAHRVTHAVESAAIVGGVGSDTVVILPGAEAGASRELAGRISAEFALRHRGQTASIVISEATVDFVDLSRSYRIARGALDLIGRRRTNVVIDLSDLGVTTLLLSHGDPEALKEFSARLLRGLDDMGASRSSELIETVTTWMDVDRSTSVAADRLHVHVNTVSYRLKTLEERLGRSLRDPSFLVDLKLALDIRFLTASNTDS